MKKVLLAVSLLAFIGSASLAVAQDEKEAPKKESCCKGKNKANCSKEEKEACSKGKEGKSCCKDKSSKECHDKKDESKKEEK